MTLIQLSTNERHFQIGYASGVDLSGSGVGEDKPIPMTALPSTIDGVHKTTDANLAKLLFYGYMDATATSDNKILKDVRIYTWAELHGVWLPTLVGEFDMVCGGQTGLALTVVDANKYFVDTITLADGDESCRIITGINDHIASITVDLEGASYLSVTFAQDAAGPENANYIIGTF
tara:strand:+ start:3111 stop:3638 length:528 start_codon:yes stop_codon:yes gene_type:complete